MSKTSRMILIAALAVLIGQRSAFADDQLPPPTTGVATNESAKPKPAPKPKTASAKAKKAAEPIEPALPLTPGPAVVRQSKVNIRGKAAINSEVIGQLQKNDKVTVIEEVTLNKPKTDEPARWAKIALPASSGVWVHSDYIDANTKTVKPRRLNLRSGPGENYSVIGRVERGAKIQEIEAREQWLKIEPPPGAYAFVAAHLLRPEIADTAIASTPPAKPLETAQVDTPPPPATATEPEKPVTETPAPAATGTSTPTQSEIVIEEEPKRVVTREGIVRRSVSIQAPTYFVLESADTGRAINYLFSTNVALKDFRGHRIQVTGEELLDERWPNTPVIAVEKLEAVP